MKEFIEKLIGRLEEEIQDVSESQSSYEAGSDMSITCSHIMGTLRDVKNRIIPKLAEEYSADTPQKFANGWIPCSERLPEEDDDVMVIYTDNDGEVDICCLDWFLAYSDTMLAWMPLPEPYKPQQESEWKDKVMKHFTKVE